MTVSRALALPLILLVKAYQLLLSPLTGASCRFYPSCSAYALTALERYGLFRGAWLTARRLLRCHPWNPGGVDHVPEKQVQRSDRGSPVPPGVTAHPVTDR
jgi:putative membrane protein insertion efficiency factor